MGKYKITPKDLCLKTWLRTKSLMRYYFNIRCNDCFKIPSEYKLKFYDNFGNKSLDNGMDASKGWNQPYHPEYLYTWFDPTQIKFCQDGVQFSAIMKPKYFAEVDQIIPVATASMRTNQSGKYGIFSIIAKLPKGTYLGPALGLSGHKNWPPEIDILEGYTDNTIDYHKNKRLSSNIHMRDDVGELYDSGAQSHRVPKRVVQEFVHYTLGWEKDFIKIYYDDYLVRHITDPKILDKMNEPMNLIVGTGVQEAFNIDNLSPMVIREIKVYQKQQLITT